MKHPKNVQIPYELFIDLIKVVAFEIDDPEIWQRAQAGLKAKLDASVAREKYTQALLKKSKAAAEIQ